MSKSIEPEIQIRRHDTYFSCTFKAMASACQILIETDDKGLAQKLSAQASAEVFRIEKKFSRYRQNNLCYKINTSNGAKTDIDEECYKLLSFADTCFQLSGGTFDITSGILRKAWVFDCSDHIPTQKEIDALLPFIGWEKVTFDSESITLKPGMELDFGGIGKEYAASSAADLCKQCAPEVSVLVNLGGDLQITKKRVNEQPWLVGIENSSERIPILEGALATSGDAKRYLLKDGVRYSHILNPKTGWPVQGAPASVTTLAPLCIQAGILATLALLRGDGATAFLNEQGVKHWLTEAD